jgi:hypothetical protein
VHPLSIREFSVSDGLISYGAIVIDAYRQVDVYSDWILKRANRLTCQSG